MLPLFKDNIQSLLVLIKQKSRAQRQREISQTTNEKGCENKKENKGKIRPTDLFLWFTNLITKAHFRNNIKPAIYVYQSELHSLVTIFFLSFAASPDLLFYCVDSLEKCF